MHTSSAAPLLPIKMHMQLMQPMKLNASMLIWKSGKPTSVVLLDLPSQGIGSSSQLFWLNSDAPPGGPKPQ